jgi:hypothetical protein
VAALDGIGLAQRPSSGGSSGKVLAGLRPTHRDLRAMPHRCWTLHTCQARQQPLQRIYPAYGMTGGLPRADLAHCTLVALKACREATSRRFGSVLTADRQLRRKSTDRSPGPGMITLIRHGIGRPRTKHSP